MPRENIHVLEEQPVQPANAVIPAETAPIRQDIPSSGTASFPIALTDDDDNAYTKGSCQIGEYKFGGLGDRASRPLVERLQEDPAQAQPMPKRACQSVPTQDVGLQHTRRVQTTVSRPPRPRPPSIYDLDETLRLLEKAKRELAPAIDTMKKEYHILTPSQIRNSEHVERSVIECMKRHRDVLGLSINHNASGGHEMLVGDDVHSLPTSKLRRVGR